MKKISVLVIVCIVMIGSIGCYNKKVEKNLFIEKVKTLEKNEIELNDLEIHYDGFKKKISGIFTPKAEKNYLEKKDEYYFRTPNEKVIYMKELENISDEKLKEYQKIVLEDSNASGLQKVDYKIEISDANYEGTFDGEKRVYSKTTRTIYFTDQESVESLLYKIYDFKKVDGEWKISHIKKSYPKIDMITRKVLEEELANTAFTPENNNKIKYIETIKLSAKSQ